MKRNVLLLMLVMMTASFNNVNARTVYGWCGYSVELSDGSSRNDIMLAAEILDLLCDIDEYGIPDEEDPEIPDDPDNPDEPVNP